tara:strand:+ start:419 stop:1126 length:708 start_codon:yes stop_codon:yes gene_type:complete
VIALQRHQMQSEEREAASRQKLAQATAQCDQYRAGMSSEGLTSRAAPAVPAASDPAAEQLPPHALPRVCAKKAQESAASSVRRHACGPRLPPSRRAHHRRAHTSLPAPQNKRAAPGADPSSASDVSTAETSPAPAADLPNSASSEAAAAVKGHASKVDEVAPANMSPQLPSAVAQTGPKPAAGWVPLQSFSPLQSASSVRVPFGYVPGAISVEMPKRQRSKANNPNFPRSYSSLV